MVEGYDVATSHGPASGLVEAAGWTPMESGRPEELADGLPGWFPRALRILSIRAVWVLIVAAIGTLVILYLARRLFPPRPSSRVA